MDALEQLLRLRVSLESGRPVPPDVSEWLQQGLQAFIDGEHGTLCKALGLRAAGRRLPSTLTALSARNNALRKALALLGGSPAALTAEVRRFQSRRWPRYRHHREPPAHFSELDRQLFAAHRAYTRVPRTPQGLTAAVKKTDAI